MCCRSSFRVSFERWSEQTDARDVFDGDRNLKGAASSTAPVLTLSMPLVT